MYDKISVGCTIRFQPYDEEGVLKRRRFFVQDISVETQGDLSPIITLTGIDSIVEIKTGHILAQTIGHQRDLGDQLLQYISEGSVIVTGPNKIPREEN